MMKIMKKILLCEICKQCIIIKKIVHSKRYKTNSSRTDDINKIKGFCLNGADISILWKMVDNLI